PEVAPDRAVNQAAALTPASDAIHQPDRLFRQRDVQALLHDGLTFSARGLYTQSVGISSSTLIPRPSRLARLPEGRLTAFRRPGRPGGTVRSTSSRSRTSPKAARIPLVERQWRARRDPPTHAQAVRQLRLSARVCPSRALVETPLNAGAINGQI